jgi:hypothetical protein
MPAAKKPAERMRKSPPRTAAEAEKVARAKKPVPVLIFRDGTNRAIAFAESQVPPGNGSVLLQLAHVLQVAAGIRSLVAERGMLRGLVKEAYLKGALDQSHRCGLAGRHEGWEQAGFPTKIERPWE